MTIERSGQRSDEPFAYFDPNTLSWKMSQESLPLESLIESVTPWPRSGMSSGGRLFGLRSVARRTGESEFSSSAAMKAFLGTTGLPLR